MPDVLIIGDTEPGLVAQHAVQTQFEKSGDKLLLVRSLENELRLLELEQRDTEVTSLKSRISQLERLKNLNTTCGPQARPCVQHSFGDGTRGVGYNQKTRR